MQLFYIHFLWFINALNCFLMYLMEHFNLYTRQIIFVCLFLGLLFMYILVIVRMYYEYICAQSCYSGRL